MGYRSLRECVNDLERTGQLIRLEVEVDPCLEAAEIQRRVYQAGGPAIYFSRVKGCQFPMVSNLFGTIERTRFLFRDAVEGVRRLVELKIDPEAFRKNPWRYKGVPFTLLNMWLRKVRSGPITAHETTIRELPQVKSWPMDGGPFVTLPQVYTEDPDQPGLGKSNLGMYRVQLGGNEYVPDREIGLHYQIHRGIGVHHAAAIRRGEPLKVKIFVGGPPTLTMSAVMPLPEGLSELLFAAALGGRPLKMVCRPGEIAMPAEADFVISGTIDPNRQLPEGPFGDHLGYYSLAHPFPVVNVDKVYHRPDPIWPFTTVGRPPQEDTSFGEFIHEITGPILPTVIHGVKAVNAVDAAGVHPLLLAIGSERYVPYAKTRQPQELLTIANAILGQGQLSLAKYLLIVAQEDDPKLDIHDIAAFLRHLLERVDWTRDLHFQTRTTIDTLDYSGSGFNSGSKLVIAAAGPKRRELATDLPAGLDLPNGVTAARVALPGVLALSGTRYEGTRESPDRSASRLADALRGNNDLHGFPLVVLVDDAEFTARTLNNFLWVVFTRSNPAADIDGVDAFVDEKHWGCRGSLLIDARIKPHHAPPLVEDPDVTRRVNRLAEKGGPLHGIL
jgi:4-hydroxy-3-polyprenylbenzoate decarboxylase